LLVEDEDRLRAACRRILAAAGYRVVEARNGLEARDLVARRVDEVQLVLTDVVMPSSSGPDLVAALRTDRPRLKVLYMSGYSDHPILRAGLLEASAAFIHKPFSPDALLRKVRDALTEG
jgi:DNA-binding NtrC family response regulator